MENYKKCNDIICGLIKELKSSLIPAKTSNEEKRENTDIISDIISDYIKAWRGVGYITDKEGRTLFVSAYSIIEGIKESLKNE